MNRVGRLALAKFLGELTPEEAAELSSLLAESAEARAEYWELLSTHAQLQWDMEGRPQVANALVELLQPASEETHSQAAATPSHTRGLFAFAVAAGLVLAAIGGGWSLWGPGQNGLASLSEDRPAEPPVVGALTALAPDSVWSFGRPGGNNSGEFHEGDTLWLEQGAAELRFASDTVALLESPVVMQVLSVDRVRLIRGGIKVEVPEGAEGFAVETATAEVIDLGTVFSVGVDNGATDVIVFDGEVDLKVAGASGELPTGAAKRFRAGQAVQVAADGTLSRIVNVQQSRLSTGQDPQQAPVIASVRDNNIRAEFYSFYEIVPGGMREDAKAFVDRPYHEWNGVRSTGMPDYLVGGDYIKTFNDDKIDEELAIEVTLDSPAELYVLLDNRLSPPEWLVDNFEETGDVIGVDEAPYYPDRNIPDASSKLGVGPGQRIDREHSIWKQVVAEGGVVLLGPNGVVVTPLETSPSMPR